MLRDVFYFGEKPNVHPRERHAIDLADAKQQCTTEHFWIINEFCDYRGFDWDFDFDFLNDEDVWTSEHNNVWPSRYQKDSGTWLCSEGDSEIIVYRGDVNPLERKDIVVTNWNIPEFIDKSSFDFKWHPDPTDPPFIYQFGTQWQKTGGPSYIVDGATEIKYMDVQISKALSNLTNWEIPDYIDTGTFDFSWHPDDTAGPFIYEFGTQWQDKGGPRYIVEGATELKYEITVKAKAIAVVKDKWDIPENIELDSFDFTWHPDPTDPPLIYQFGTQHQKTGGPRYIVDGATELKYVSNQIAKVIPNKSDWFIPKHIDDSKFDFSWHPDSTEENFIYQFGTQWQKTGGPRYIKNTTSVSDVKYVDDITAIAIPDTTRWKTLLEVENFDYSWHPDDTEEPYIYVFGNQWHDAITEPTLEYTVEGATNRKFITDTIATASPTDNWETIIPVDNFDYSWRPNPNDPPYIYVFGNQWNRAELEPTVRYVVEGATEIKYVTDILVTASAYTEGWEILEDIEKFDYSWRPNPTEQPYTYVFGNKQYPGTIMPTIRLHKPGATQEKFIDDIVATLVNKPELFVIPKALKAFDFSWRPNPKDPPYIYQFGTQWAKTHGPQFIVEGADEVKFVEFPKSIVSADMTNWEASVGIDITKFDFSWHPDATSPPYIYQFGTIIDENDGPRYIVPGSTEIVHLERPESVDTDIEFNRYYIETTLEDLIILHPDEVFWALNADIDYSDFNFEWRPDIQQIKYVHAFGTSENINTQTYFVNAPLYREGFTDINYIEDNSLIIRTTLDMFFVDKSNIESQQRFLALQQRFPKLQKTRYLNSWVETINRCLNKSSTKLCWILNSELDYTEFEFDYYPNPWQMSLVHVFGTQYSHWGTTFMVNRDTFAEDTKYIKIIEHLSTLNFVKNRRATATDCLYDVFVIDHGNIETPLIIDILKQKTTGKALTTVPYSNSYFDTFKQILKAVPNKKEHYIWVCSSICDYNNFDFKYICDPFAREQLHVFPSDKQKFGDTFLVDVNRLRELMDTMETLEDYRKVNYNNHMRVKRLPEPVIISESDTHVSTIHSDYNWPYATYITSDNKEIKVTDNEPMSLWDIKHKTIKVTSTGGTRIVVPKEAKDYVKRELYDYPYITTNFKLTQSQPLDIVFLSNGEVGAEDNYQRLLKVTKNLPNRVVRVDGVNGRVAAYHAAAEASNTPWMFTVFAKLYVNENFDWNWQPDRLQLPKHYIFHATNPVNKLEYGHQAMIAYNKKITLANSGRGLDFTLDDEHEVVQQNSGIAVFNTDAWSTWRTAFREALKLCADDSYISENRLKIWLTVGEGSFSEYSVNGAKDAVEYYKEVNGDLELLRLSYDWPWLRAKFDTKYNKS